MERTAPVTTMSPATGSGHGRRHSSGDLALSGPLLARLYLVAGSGIVVHGALATSGTPRLLELGVGAVALAFGGISSRVQWESASGSLLRLVPLVTAGAVAVMAFGSQQSIILSVVTLALSIVWTGVALQTVDLVINSVIVSGVLGGALWKSFHAANALGEALATAVLLVGLGASMQWMRRRFDLSQQQASSARQRVADAAMAAERTRGQQETERGAIARAELDKRANLQQQVMNQVATLAAAASGVSNQAGAVSAAVDEMSHALQELTRTAQVSDQISENVAVKAREASEVMAALAESSAQIMAASDVIQGIAEQTNLLALNATIESARAGEAGRGFAVVANEVKDLARQSGDNADTITRTLAEVRSQVDAAVTRVAEISASMDELNRQNGTLAAAIEEQSAVVQQIAQSVGSTATEADRMAEGVRSLERIAGH